jgi:hypothetical protein
MVAEVDGIGISEENAINILHRSGIDATARGSWSWGVFVPQSQFAKAQSVLIADEKLHPYHYGSIIGYSEKLVVPDVSKLPLRTFDIDFTQIGLAPEFRADSNLRGLARQAQEDLHDDLASKPNRRPYISGMRLFPMQYTDKKGAIETGCRATVYVGFRSSKATYEIFAYSWNHGTCHQSRGSCGYPD